MTPITSRRYFCEITWSWCRMFGMHQWIKRFEISHWLLVAGILMICHRSLEIAKQMHRFHMQNMLSVRLSHIFSPYIHTQQIVHHPYTLTPHIHYVYTHIQFSYPLCMYMQVWVLSNPNCQTFDSKWYNSYVYKTSDGSFITKDYTHHIALICIRIYFCCGNVVQSKRT